MASKLLICQFSPTVITGHHVLSNVITGHCELPLFRTMQLVRLQRYRRSMSLAPLDSTILHIAIAPYHQRKKLWPDTFSLRMYTATHPPEVLKSPLIPNYPYHLWLPETCSFLQKGVCIWCLCTLKYVHLGTCWYQVLVTKSTFATISPIRCTSVGSSTKQSWIPSPPKFYPKTIVENNQISSEIEQKA